MEIKYLDIEFLFGSNLGIRPADVFAIEDIILDKENGDYLDDFGTMILKLFSSSEMGHYYLGKYYESGCPLFRRGRELWLPPKWLRPFARFACFVGLLSLL